MNENVMAAARKNTIPNEDANPVKAEFPKPFSLTYISVKKNAIFAKEFSTKKRTTINMGFKGFHLTLDPI